MKDEYVWIAVGFGIYSEETGRKILFETYCECKARGLEKEFLDVVDYDDKGYMSVPSSSPVADVMLEVCSKYGVVPAIT